MRADCRSFVTSFPSRHRRGGSGGRGGGCRRPLRQPVLRHPAAGPERQRHPRPDPAQPGLRQHARTRLEPAGPLRRPRQGPLRPHQRDDQHLLQRRLVRRPVRSGGLHPEARRAHRRHDRPGQEDRCAAHHRYHQVRHRVRRRLRGRPGPAVADGRLPPRRTGTADLLRGRGALQPGPGAAVLASRPLHGGRSPGPDRQRGGLPR